MEDIILFMLIIVAFLTSSILIIYNKIVKLRNNVLEKESGIDICLNERFDLIPNIVETVKGYSKHENNLFEDIAKLRNNYNSNPRNLKNVEKLNNEMNKLIAIAESYPELKADMQYLNLQKNLSKIEEKLEVARTKYNNSVTSYNNKIETVPSNFIAQLFGFKKAKLFNLDNSKKDKVIISFK